MNTVSIEFGRIVLHFLLVFITQYGHGFQEVFFQRQKELYLPNGLITTKHTRSELECSIHCARLEGCLSVNYKVGGKEQELCELNNTTIYEKNGVNDDNFVYLAITVWVCFALIVFT